jgi:hypothetical protein
MVTMTDQMAAATGVPETAGSEATRSAPETGGYILNSAPFIYPHFQGKMLTTRQRGSTASSGSPDPRRGGKPLLVRQWELWWPA